MHFFCIYLVDFMLSCDSLFCRPLPCCISTICFDRCIFHRSSGSHHTSIVLLHAREYPIVDAFRSKTRFFCDQCDRCNILHFIRSSWRNDTKHYCVKTAIFRVRRWASQCRAFVSWRVFCNLLWSSLVPVAICLSISSFGFNCTDNQLQNTNCW